jgi:hypothetical protein
MANLLATPAPASERFDDDFGQQGQTAELDQAAECQ